MKYSVLYKIFFFLLPAITLTTGVTAQVITKGTALRGAVKAVVVQDSAGQHIEYRYDTAHAATPAMLKRKSVTSQSTVQSVDCACNCLQPLFDYLTDAKRLFIPATQKVLLSSLVADASEAGYKVSYIGCPLLEMNINKYFYALSSQQSAELYRAQLGDCTISINSLTGQAIDFNNLSGTRCDGGVLYMGTGTLYKKTFTAINTIHSLHTWEPIVYFPNAPRGSSLYDAGTKFMSACMDPNGEQAMINGYVVFDSLTALPANAIYKKARLRLFPDPAGGFYPTLPGAHKVGALFEFGVPQFALNSNTGLDSLEFGPWWNFENSLLAISSSVQEVNVDISSWIPFAQEYHANGFLLQSHSIAGELLWATFCSEKHPDVSKRPRVEVEYMLSSNTNQAYLSIDSCNNCEVINSGICYSAITDTTVNPTASGIIGNWRPYRSYAYYASRKEADPLLQTNIRKDGTFADFKAFWDKTGGRWSAQQDTSRWVWNAESTLFNKKGLELENRDPLGRYNAGLYGYDDALPTAVVNNSRYRESAFDGFEDYFFTGNVCDVSCPPGRSFDFSAYKNNFVTTQQHTGLFSLRVKKDSTVSIAAAVVTSDNKSFNLTVAKTPNDCNTGEALKGIKTNEDALLPSFSPMAGQKMLISAWVKEELPCTGTTYTGSRISVSFNTASGPTTVTAQPSGNIIEGWQRYEFVATIPANATSVFISLKATGSGDVYFDDLRVHPYNGNMKSYVYSAENLRLMSELDENNYATFYEYDDDGSLIRVKKETERGIKTITENRSGLIKE